MTFRSHNGWLCCTAQFVAVIACFWLSGCGSVELFGQYDLEEDPAVAETPWPRLVDTPTAPEVGSYSQSAPDPAIGARTQTDLATAAVFAEGRAKELSEPVIRASEKARLLKNAAINSEQRAVIEAQAAEEARKKRRSATQ